MKHLQKVVFFGSHELAVPCLESLDALGLRPELIVTRPESGLEVPEEMADEGGPEPAHPVIDWARAHDVPRILSRRAGEPKLYERIAEIAPDLLVVADFGRPLPMDLVNSVPRGAVEIHPSLLPKYRGSHALRAAIADGNSKVGVTSFLLDEEPWGGDIVEQEELPIGKKETFRLVLPRMEDMVREVTTRTITKLDRKTGKPKLRKQNHKIATATPKMGRRYRKMPWSMEANQVFDRLRAITPGGLYAHCRLRPVRILSGLPLGWEKGTSGEVGTYLGMRQGKLAVMCGSDTVFGLIRLQRPGDEPLSASEFNRKEMLRVGDRFV